MEKTPETSITVPVTVQPAVPVEPPAEATDYQPRWERVPVERRSEFLFTVRRIDDIQLGEITFLEDGSINLGNKVFAGGTAIMNHAWGAYVANRGQGAQQLLAIDRPEGETFYYCFQDGIWYRYVPLVSRQNILMQTLSERVRQSGWAVASVQWMFELLDGALAFAFTAAVCFGVLAVLAWARS